MYTFWALVFALCVVALANFFLTVTILWKICIKMEVETFFSVLCLTKSMENIDVVPTANLLKLIGELDINKLIKSNGIISSFDESPVTFTSYGSDITLKVI